MVEKKKTWVNWGYFKPCKWSYNSIVIWSYMNWGKSSLNSRYLKKKLSHDKNPPTFHWILGWLIPGSLYWLQIIPIYLGSIWSPTNPLNNQGTFFRGSLITIVLGPPCTNQHANKALHLLGHTGQAKVQHLENGSRLPLSMDGTKENTKIRGR